MGGWDESMCREILFFPLLKHFLSFPFFFFVFQLQFIFIIILYWFQVTIVLIHTTFPFLIHITTLRGRYYHQFLLIFLLIDFRETGREGEKERETLMCCSSYLCIHQLILLRALTRGWSHNLGASQWHAKELSCAVRAHHPFFKLERY